MIELCYQIALGLACLIICGYLFFELHYFGRSLVCVILAKCKKRVHVLDETTLRGLCITTDIDNLLTHMNNARFIRELDFAKIDFFERSGLLRLVRKHKGSICLGSTTVRYRRFIKLFSFYKVSSKIIYWDSGSIYMEHRFITTSDNFVNAIVLCRTRITHCDVEALMTDALQVPEGGNIEHAKREKPEMTLVLRKWIEHNELSSAMLRSTESTGPDGAPKSKENGHANFTKEVNGNTSIMQADQIKRVDEVVGCTNPTFNDHT